MKLILEEKPNYKNEDKPMISIAELITRKFNTDDISKEVVNRPSIIFISKRVKIYLPEYQNKYSRMNELNDTNFNLYTLYTINKMVFIQMIILFMQIKKTYFMLITINGINI